MNKVLIAVIAILIGLYFVNFEGKDEASAINDEKLQIKRMARKLHLRRAFPKTMKL